MVRFLDRFPLVDNAREHVRELKTFLAQKHTGADMYWMGAPAPSEGFQISWAHLR